MKGREKQHWEDQLRSSTGLTRQVAVMSTGFGLGYTSKNQLIAAIQRACRGVSKLEFALFTPTTTFEKLSSKLRSSIITHDNRNAANTQLFTEC